MLDLYLKLAISAKKWKYYDFANKALNTKFIAIEWRKVVNINLV